MPITRSQRRSGTYEDEADSQDENVLLEKEEKTKDKMSRTFKEEVPNMILLVVLYLLQGIPLGLAMGSVPYLLKRQKLSYAQLATFSLAAYPYSVKLLWSPVVDSVYFKSFGRRKSWIIPIQFIVSVLLFYIGSWVDEMLVSPDLDVNFFTLIFLLLVFFSATQDIAVDGWALELLAENHISYASTAQTIGLNSGFFLSYTIFLAFNSASFCNSYIRSMPSEEGILSLGSYMIFWSILYFIVTIFLFFFKEKASSSDASMKQVYIDIWKVMSLPNMTVFVAILLIAKIGFVTDDSVSGFKYMEKGWKEEDLGISSLINFPLQIIFGYYAAKWSQGPRKLKPWLYAFYGRLFIAILDTLTVYYFPKTMNTPFFIWVIMTYVLCNYVRTVQFVSMGAFFALIADPTIGGTYMTLLNTLSNFGGTYPQYFVLKAVDMFTRAECELESGNPFYCINKEDKTKCKETGGVCNVYRDGYYIVSFSSILVGVITLIFFIRPHILTLEQIPPKSWRIKKSVK